jgi:hypothetical protein|tara:strand:- start:173 stop:640 length:468 start_codon:yes stop_codon:yes gene_type:complete
MNNMSIIPRVLKGNIGITLVTAITALSMAGVAMQMGYSNFKLKAEKQLHILNAIRFATIVQIGLEEGWVETPDNNTSATISLTDIDASYPLLSHLKNPSQVNQTYHADSSVTINNTSGSLNFYCSLIEDGSSHEYTNTTISIYELTVEDISLNID